MRRIISAKESTRGIFWIIEGELTSFPFTGESLDGVAKSGNTFNHKKLWQFVKPKGCNRPYNFYPRGRVELNGKSKPVIYLNLNIKETYISEIKTDFGLREEPIIHYDYSEHYKCYLDSGWKAD